MAGRTLKELAKSNPLWAAALLIHAGISTIAMAIIGSGEIPASLGPTDVVRAQVAFSVAIAPTVILGSLLGLSRFGPEDIRLLRDRLTGILWGVLTYAPIYLLALFASLAIPALLALLLGCFGIGSADPRFAWGTFGICETVGGAFLVGYLLTGRTVPFGKKGGSAGTGDPGPQPPPTDRETPGKPGPG